MTQSHLIAIGGNLPVGKLQPLDVIPQAIASLSRYGLTVTAQSALYRTAAFPPGAGPDFVNAAVVVTSPLSPPTVLEKLHEIEQIHGRERHQRWAGRTLDLDLLASGDQVLPSVAIWHEWHDLAPDQQRVKTPETLILPHPRIQDRAFVLIPLRDVAPHWCHPVLGLSVAQMCKNLGSQACKDVVKLSDSPCQ